MTLAPAVPRAKPLSTSSGCRAISLPARSTRWFNHVNTSSSECSAITQSSRARRRGASRALFGLGRQQRMWMQMDFAGARRRVLEFELVVVLELLVRLHVSLCNGEPTDQSDEDHKSDQADGRVTQVESAADGLAEAV